MLNDSKFRVISYDDAYKATRTMENKNQLTNEDRVFALLLAVSGYLAFLDRNAERMP